MARVQAKHYEPTIEWDVFRVKQWVGTVRAPRTNDTLGMRDAHALAQAQIKFRTDAVRVAPRRGG